MSGTSSNPTPSLVLAAFSCALIALGCVGKGPVSGPAPFDAGRDSADGADADGATDAASTDMDGAAPDTGDEDGGSDAAAEGGVETCPPCTDGQVCDPVTLKCEQCVLDDQCPSGKCLPGRVCTCAGDTDCGAGFCDDGQCIECRSDDDCADACVSGRCEQCGAPSDCSPESPRCEDNACTRCQDDADCEGLYPAAPVCHSGTGQCVACERGRNETQCGGTDSPHCDPSGVCRACVEDADCPQSEPICASDHRCRGCEASAECEGRSAATPVCDPGNGQCFECVPGVETQACGEAGQQVCAPSRECEQCAANTDCDASAPVCSTGYECVACVDNEDCNARFSGTPVCDASDSGACVQCVADGDCSQADAARCDVATNGCTSCDADEQCVGIAGKGVCSVPDGECVECVLDTDCTFAGAARCAGNVCVPCDDDSQCVGIVGGAELNVCSEGVCVECRLDPLLPGDDGYDELENSKREVGCDAAVSCNPATNACTATGRGTVPTCGSCVSDAECGVGQRCVGTLFQGQPQGGHCLPVAGEAGCAPARPFGVGLADRASLSGAPVDNYCGVAESVATCEAVRSLVGGAACGAGGASDCANAGARCETIDFSADQCTYSCGTVNQCPIGFTCDNGYCES